MGMVEERKKELDGWCIAIFQVLEEGETRRLHSIVVSIKIAEEIVTNHRLSSNFSVHIVKDMGDLVRLVEELR